MQALLEHATGVDELATVTDRAEQRLHLRWGARAAGALAQQPDQCGAVAVVGLKPP
jgi:hypothetical protein